MRERFWAVLSEVVLNMEFNNKKKEEKKNGKEEIVFRVNSKLYNAVNTEMTL